MWSEPINKDEFKEIKSEQTEEKKIKISLDEGPDKLRNLYDVVKYISDHGTFFSRICFITKLKQIENVNLEKLKEHILEELKKNLSKQANIMCFLLNYKEERHCVFVLEVSVIII